MTDKNTKPISYADSGVNIDHGNQLVERIKPAVKATSRTGVASELGGFGGLFDLKACGFSDPILVSATDGVGTKLRLAIDAGIYDTVGIDLVAMCVNDIIVQGAEPLFFLDYFASGSLEVELACEVINGIAKGCEIAGAALIGGETAEMPDMYAAKDFDLAGFCVGAVERHKLLDGKKVSCGDRLLGLASSGVHSNGFSLVRKILVDAKKRPQEFVPPVELNPLEQTLLTPTRIYVKPILTALDKHQINAIAHITGGGISENVPRVLPAGLGVNVDLKSWELPAIFRWLMDTGPVEEREMLRTFNCGIGLILVVPANECAAVKNTLAEAGETVFDIGEVTDRLGDEIVSYTGNLR